MQALQKRGIHARILKQSWVIVDTRLLDVQGRLSQQCPFPVSQTGAVGFRKMVGEQSLLSAHRRPGYKILVEGDDVRALTTVAPGRADEVVKTPLGIGKIVRPWAEGSVCVLQM